MGPSSGGQGDELRPDRFALALGNLLVREPSDHPTVKVISARTDVVANVGEEFRTIAPLRLDGEAAPEVVEAGDFAVRRKGPDLHIAGGCATLANT
jgi:hypothetical protein